MSAIRTKEEHLAHYGILRRSGRYPWGSGGTQNARNRTFLEVISQQRKQGMSEAKIAESWGITTTQLRAANSIATHQQRQMKIIQAQKMKDRGWSNVKIGERMGLNESSVRALLAPGAKDKADALHVTSSMIKKHVDEKKYIQVGKGVEAQLGITSTRLNNSVAVLQEQGYKVYNIKQPQLGTGKFTTIKVLAKPGVTLSEVQRNRSEIKLINEYSQDNGRSFLGTQPPISISSRKVQIKYGDEGGKGKDGVIYIRPGVKGLSIGAKRYGQVRIAVDKTHFMKGMAVYKDDLPEGVDLVYHTNKKRGTPLKSKDPEADTIFKPMTKDPELPFGSLIRQQHDPKTGKVNSAINLVGSPTKEGAGEEGHWDTWKRDLPSQVLSKQSPDLARSQLGLTYERRQREFDEVNSLTNPMVRRDQLLKFADSTDSAAVHLQAASLPRQATKVILPVPSMKPGEIYAPTFRDGERVALVRFPHGGKFEIPELTVNNRNREARKMIGTGKDSPRHDAVGIHHSVAERLSGADFDGDTVLVIPNNKKYIKSDPALEGLKGFDPHSFKRAKDAPYPKVDDDRKQMEMGKISNLITDMTIHGANTQELSQAIRHSMVVIDSEKHDLDFRLSEKEHGILSLKERYQSGKRKGAQTLLSRAGADQFVLDRVERRASRGGPIDPVTGHKVYELTGRKRPVYKTKIDPETGQKIKVKTDELTDVKIRSTKLAETHDARDLIGPKNTHIENIYADHSNRLKALANDARKEAVRIKLPRHSPSARSVYRREVESLTAKLRIAERNAPLEKQAQLLAGHELGLRRKQNPHMEKDELNKLKQALLNKARARTGAAKKRIEITDSEWHAIQAGAVSNKKLKDILTHSNPDRVRELALPKRKLVFSPTMKSRAQTMLDSGYTQAEVADQLGVTLTTLKVGLEG